MPLLFSALLLCSPIFVVVKNHRPVLFSSATGGTQCQYYCCQGGADSEGCTVSRVHVTDVQDYNNIRGFVATLDRTGDPLHGGAGTGRVFALDCEMCNTTLGSELTRVTVVDYRGR